MSKTGSFDKLRYYHKFRTSVKTVAIMAFSKSSFSPALGRESDACSAGLSDFEKAIRRPRGVPGMGEAVLTHNAVLP